MEIKAMIKNDCTFCFKALELQRALDLGLIAERNRCNEKIKAIEYEKQVLSDRLGIAELGYIDFIEYYLSSSLLVKNVPKYYLGN